MSRVLFVTDIVPYPLEHGMSLRVVNLARSLGPNWTSYLAHCGRDPEAEANLAALNVFADSIAMPMLSKPRSPLRYFRLDDSNLYTRFSGTFASEAIVMLRRAVLDWSIDVVVGMNFKMADFVCALDGMACIVDECDCRTLTIERAMSRESASAGLMQSLSRNVTLMRIRRAEGALADNCDLVTTVSPADGARLAELSSCDARIEVVPNGVSPDLLDRPAVTDRGARAIAFWGNLDFDVNQEAVRYFHDEIYVPHLASQGIDLHIIGKSSSGDVNAMPEGHDGIVLPGFVDDLAGYLENIPLMVNPMVMGSGLKNKVIEAFCLGIVVVSTSMGVEALDVENGVHCVIEDDPRLFAQAVTDLLDDPARRKAMAMRARTLVEDRYSWPKIGGRFAQLMSELLVESG